MLKIVWSELFTSLRASQELLTKQKKTTKCNRILPLLFVPYLNDPLHKKYFDVFETI